MKVQKVQTVALVVRLVAQVAQTVALAVRLVLLKDLVKVQNHLAVLRTLRKKG